MTSSELESYITQMSEMDRGNLSAIADLDLDTIDAVLARARTEEQRKFAEVARLVHLGRRTLQENNG